MAREYEDALLWLEEAGLVYRIYNVTKPGIPLSSYKDVSAFKLYAFDCGILRRLSKLSPEIILSGHLGFTEFKGALAENAILQSLEPQFNEKPYYWTSRGEAEVDFIIESNKNIYPVEVKGGTNRNLKSLRSYAGKYQLF